MSTIVKIIFSAAAGLIILTGCNQQSTKDNSTANLAMQIQDLKDKYRPGLGEYMMGIQVHHGKLWYAGVNNNWKLADYEISEIKESFDDIKAVETDRPEVKTIGIIEPALVQLTTAITDKNEKEFKDAYTALTASCNNCHTANHYEFNVITIPTAPPVYDQDFTAKP